jgi:hypothetical protein
MQRLTGRVTAVSLCIYWVNAAPVAVRLVLQKQAAYTKSVLDAGGRFRIYLKALARRREM